MAENSKTASLRALVAYVKSYVTSVLMSNKIYNNFKTCVAKSGYNVCLYGNNALFSHCYTFF